MWLGNSEKNLHAAFEAARQAAPAVLFFDEVDAVGLARNEQRGGTAMRNVLASFLTELDGVGNDNESVFVLAATNQPWDVDAALRRPGRFDKTALVLPPDESARRSILMRYLRDRPTGTLDLDSAARRSDGYSGADLRRVCEQATEFAFEEATRGGSLVPIEQRHLEASLAFVPASLGPWLETARNYVRYANDDGAYDELARYLRRRK